MVNISFIPKLKVTVPRNRADTYSPPTTNAWILEWFLVTGGQTEMTSQENKHLGGTPQNYNIISYHCLKKLTFVSQLHQCTATSEH